MKKPTRQRTQHEAELLLGRMALDELRETQRLVQAELARRESRTIQPIQAWGHLVQRHG
jgi:hypothetical protein